MNVLRYFTFVLCISSLGACFRADRADVPHNVHDIPEWTIAIHGGAGNFGTESLSEEQVIAYTESLSRALQVGTELLERGGEAIDVVTEVIALLEDDSLFNAGRGAVMTADRTHELDASIMRGDDRNAGAVSGLRNVKNPIRAARLVMFESEHVFLSGEGADRFSEAFGLEMVPNSWFTTTKVSRALDKVLDREAAKLGTVGCVVRDKEGRLAAGTSTGGMMAKRHGRIGDSPVIGAGTWADNATCAVSCTGHGEFFIRHAVAHSIAARMAFGGESLTAAAHAVVMNELVEAGGSGGIIAVDHLGNAAMVFNTKGMFRGMQRAGEPAYIGLFEEP